MNQYGNPFDQLTLLKEDNIHKHQPAKRVNIVSLKLVKESSMLYKERSVKSPEDAYVFSNFKNGYIRMKEMVEEVGRLLYFCV
jgi:hypothetical protein